MDPAQTAKLRTELTLAEEPDGVQTVSEVRMALLGEAAPNVVALLETEHDEADGIAAAPAGDGEGDEPTNGGVADDAGTEETHDHDPDHADHDHAAHDHDHAGHDHADHDHAHDDHEGHEHAAGRDVKEMDVVLVGVVGGIPNPSSQTYAEFPFSKDHAMFFLADPEAVADLEEHGHQHAPGEECAFCAAHAADATALIAAVQFADEQGKVYPVDARDLFDLKEGETVVIRGKAKGQAGGIITVDATGLYVRR